MSLEKLDKQLGGANARASVLPTLESAGTPSEVESLAGLFSRLIYQHDLFASVSARTTAPLEDKKADHALRVALCQDLMRIWSNCKLGRGKRLIQRIFMQSTFDVEVTLFDKAAAMTGTIHGAAATSWNVAPSKDFTPTAECERRYVNAQLSANPPNSFAVERDVFIKKCQQTGARMTARVYYSPWLTDADVHVATSKTFYESARQTWYVSLEQTGAVWRSGGLEAWVHNCLIRTSLGLCAAENATGNPLQSSEWAKLGLSSLMLQPPSQATAPRLLEEFDSIQPIGAASGKAISLPSQELSLVKSLFAGQPAKFPFGDWSQISYRDWWMGTAGGRTWPGPDKIAAATSGLVTWNHLSSWAADYCLSLKVGSGSLTAHPRWIVLLHELLHILQAVSPTYAVVVLSAYNNTKIRAYARKFYASGSSAEAEPDRRQWGRWFQYAGLAGVGSIEEMAAVEPLPVGVPSRKEVEESLANCKELLRNLMIEDLTAENADPGFKLKDVGMSHIEALNTNTMTDHKRFSHWGLSFARGFDFVVPSAVHATVDEMLKW